MLPPMTASFVTRREVVYLTLAIFNGLTTCALLLWGGSGGLFTGGKQANLLTREHPAWAHLMNSKFVDLTHSIHPQMPLWPLFAQPSFSSAVAAHSSPGAPEIVRNASFTYARQGFVAGAMVLPTDQLGTQLDPPAHWNEFGATISDIPPTVSLRPLVVIDVSTKVASDPGYHVSAEDCRQHESMYGTIPAGAVVLIRTDWALGWDSYAGPNGMPAIIPGVGLDALKFLHLERLILAHGHEPLDTDGTPSLEGEAWLMHNHYMQFEGVANLHLLPPTGCLLSIGFAKVEGGAGGLARLVAVCPPESTHGSSIAEAPAAPLTAQAAPLRRDAYGVMRPTEGAKPTEYCAEGVDALGCGPNSKFA